MRIKIVFFFILSFSIVVGCSENKAHGEYQVINFADIAGEYKRVYCSDYFSSLEIIPLETNKNCLVVMDPAILVNDSLIFVTSIVSLSRSPFPRNVLVFNHSGKFLNQIGAIGRGPGEYTTFAEFFINEKKSTAYIADVRNILEYDFDGKFIGSFPKPIADDGLALTNFSSVENNLFIGAIPYSRGHRNKFCLFDRNGDIVKCFPSHYFFDSGPQIRTLWVLFIAEMSFKMGEDLYLMDCINDTLYLLKNLHLQPTYVFDFGKYSYPLEGINENGKIEIKQIESDDARRFYMRIREITGTPNYFFYSIEIPSILPTPKSRPVSLISEIALKHVVFGIYDIENKSNIFLDTDQLHQRGLINDINGGLSFFPRYYAGNGIVADFWRAEDMKEILTEEYFASIDIKDQAAHQKLRELLKKLDEEDNPVVVLAKLK